MSRYIQSGLGSKSPRKEPKPREMTKPGSYTAKDLEAAKKILTPHGGKR